MNETEKPTMTPTLREAAKLAIAALERTHHIQDGAPERFAAADALRAALAVQEALPAVGEPSTQDETGWLIEHKYQETPTSWIAVGSDFKSVIGGKALTHVHDASKALRFARKEDAEAVLRMHLGSAAPDWLSTSYSVTEHMWPAPPVQAPASVAPADEYCWLVELFEHQGNSLGRYYTGQTDLHNHSRSVIDAHYAKRYAAKHEAEAAAIYLNLYMKTGEWRAIEHAFIAPTQQPQPPSPEQAQQSELGPDPHPPSRRCDCKECVSYFDGAPISASDGVIYAAQQSVQAVPEGFVLVPREATDAMMEAFEASSGDQPRTWEKAWAAMLAAAPTSPALGAAPPVQGEQHRDWELACDECAGTGKVDVSAAIHVDGRYMGDDLFRECCNECGGYGFTICVADIPKKIIIDWPEAPAPSVPTQELTDAPIQRWSHDDGGSPMRDRFGQWVKWEDVKQIAALGTAHPVRGELIKLLEVARYLRLKIGKAGNETDRLTLIEWADAVEAVIRNEGAK